MGSGPTMTKTPNISDFGSDPTSSFPGSNYLIADRSWSLVLLTLQECGGIFETSDTIPEVSRERSGYGQDVTGERLLGASNRVRPLDLK